MARLGSGRSGPVAGPRLVAVAVVAGDGDPLLPCGRCRQLLLEAGGPALLVDTAGGPVPLDELLPAAFGGARTCPPAGCPARPPDRSRPATGERMPDVVSLIHSSAITPGR